MSKKTVLSFVFALLTLSGISQVTEVFSNEKLSSVFKVLERKYGIKVSYDPKLVKPVRITAKVVNKTGAEALGIFLENADLAFIESGSNYFAVYRDPKKKIGGERKSYNFWVIDGISKEVVPYVKVRIVGTNTGVYADDHGQVSLSSQLSTFTLEVRTLGFRKKYISSASLKKGLRVVLTPDILEYPEVVVEYLAEGMSTTNDGSSITIRPRRLGVTPGTTEPDVFKTIQNVPGINSANEAVSEIQIRGGTSDQNLIVWEGIPLYHSGHFNGMISSINANVIDKSIIHRGVYDPSFGGRASGLIEMNSLDRIPERVEAGGGLNLLHGDLYAKIPLKKKIALLGSVRRSYVDVLNTPVYRSYANRVYQETKISNEDETFTEVFEDTTITNVIENNNVFSFIDLNAKLLFHPSPKHKYAVSFLRTNNELRYESLETEDSILNRNSIQTTTFGASYQSRHQWKKNWETLISGSYGTYEYNFTDEYFEEDTVVAFSVDKGNVVQSLTWKIDNQVKLSDKHELAFGYQGDRNNVSFEVFEREEEDTLYFENGRSVGITNALHVNHEWRTERWFSKVGARMVHYSLMKRAYVEPRIYAQYKLSDKITAKAGIGFQNQFISQVEDLDQAQFGLSNRIWVLAEEDEDIPVIQSNIINVGAVARWKGWHMEVDAYTKSIQGIVNFADDNTLSSGYDRGNARTVGVDFLLKKRWEGYRTWITYSLSRVNYLFEELSTDDFRAPYDQPHIFRWVNNFTYKKLEISSAFKIASGKPYTSASGLEIMGDADPFEELSEQYQVKYNQINGSRLPIYHRLDFSAMYTIDDKSKMPKWKIKIGVSLLNIYNQTNYLSRSYRIDSYFDEEDEEHLEAVTVDRYFLKFTPNAVIRFEFR